MAARVLVISPHADDETFGMGGTILKRVAAGDSVHVVAVCAGDVRFEHTGTVIPRSTRVDELATVVKAYGCSGEILPFTQESRLDSVLTVDVVNAIERVQDQFRADVWYIAGPSYHQDHRKVYEACMAALRPSRLHVPSEVYMYETPVYSWNPAQWRLVPHVYENIGEVLDRKIEICEMYKSQARVGPLSTTHIREFGVACGTEVGISAAERFEVVRVVK